MGTQIRRFGAIVEADDAFYAAGDIDLAAKRVALRVQTNAVDRHMLLQSLVGQLYRQRRQSPNGVSELIQVARLHLSELPHLIPELQRHDRLNRTFTAQLERDRAQQQNREPHPVVNDPGGSLPVIETFGHLCMVLCEQGAYEDAMAVWQRAIEVGYITSEDLPHWEQLIRKRKLRNEKAAAKAAT